MLGPGCVGSKTWSGGCEFFALYGCGIFCRGGGFWIDGEVDAGVLRGFCCGPGGTDGAYASPLVVRWVALSEAGSVHPLWFPRDAVRWWPVYSLCSAQVRLSLLGGSAAELYVRCCAVLAGPASPAVPTRPAALG